jgi:hypothetical protein
MSRPLYSELSLTEKIAALTEWAKRYAAQGAVPDFVCRAEMAAAQQGTPEEQLKVLEWLVPFFAGWAGVSNQDLAADLNDPEYLDESGEPLSDGIADRVAMTWLFLNDNHFQNELRKKGIEGDGMFPPSALPN